MFLQRSVVPGATSSWRLAAGQRGFTSNLSVRAGASLKMQDRFLRRSFTGVFLQPRRAPLLSAVILFSIEVS